METLILKPGREKSLLKRHQWVFSGAIAVPPETAIDGDTILIADSYGQPIAVAAYSKTSQISARVWSFDPNELIDEKFFRSRIKAAINYRRQLGLLSPAGGCRVVASEADMLPGFIIDIYANVGVIEILCTGADRHKNIVANILMQELELVGIYERGDAKIRTKEKLPEHSGTLLGTNLPPESVIEENGVKYAVDFRAGHKTGFYLDQRDNRQIVAALAKDKTMLNCFSYTGGFGIAAAVNGAKHIVNVDSSAPSLAYADKNFALNNISTDQYENICADAFSQLRKFRFEKRSFDLIVLDPPKLIEGQKDLIRGGRAYKDMALVAYQLLNPNGILVNFSCSGLMSSELFQNITFEAALDSKVSPRIIRRLEQAPDHPTLLTQPEGFYLKGLITKI